MSQPQLQRRFRAKLNGKDVSGVRYVTTNGAYLWRITNDLMSHRSLSELEHIEWIDQEQSQESKQ